MSQWDDPVYKSAYNCLSMEDKKKYETLGELMYNNNYDYNDPKVTEYNYAKKIHLMLRDGLAFDELSLQEKRIFIEAYGLESATEFLEPNSTIDINLETSSQHQETENILANNESQTLEPVEGTQTAQIEEEVEAKKQQNSKSSLRRRTRHKRDTRVKGDEQKPPRVSNT